MVRGVPPEVEVVNPLGTFSRRLPTRSGTHRLPWSSTARPAHEDDLRASTVQALLRLAHGLHRDGRSEPKVQELVHESQNFQLV